MTIEEKAAPKAKSKMFRNAKPNAEGA